MSLFVDQQIDQTPIPFLLSAPERILLDDLAGRISDAKIQSVYGPEALNSARIIADPTADPDVPICLCSGTGQLLGEVLSAGFRLVSEEERAATAQAANALIGRIVVAMAPSAEDVSADDNSFNLSNVYRAGMNLPLRSSRLGEDQLAIVVRESKILADLLNMELRVGELRVGGESVSSVDEAELYAPLVDMIKNGQDPIISFVDRATGGRPGVVGSVKIINVETFFATFTVSFVVGDQRVVREGISNGSDLRQTLIELGRARMESLKS